MPCHLLVVAALVVSAAPPAEAESFLSGGKSVPVVRFSPKGPGPFPAVVLLHGLDGPGGNHYRTVARGLAAKGYVVLVPHYHARTGTKPAELPGLCRRFAASVAAGGPMPADLRDVFVGWQAAARDAVAHARTLPEVDADRVALVGVSCGGFLASSLAAEPTLRIRCVVELFGGMPRETAVRKCPPMLVLHGDKDKVVPVAEAHALRSRLLAAGAVCEFEVYKGVGHCFQDTNSFTAYAAALDAQTRAHAFLATHTARRTEVARAGR